MKRRESPFRYRTPPPRALATSIAGRLMTTRRTFEVASGQVAVEVPVPKYVRGRSQAIATAMRITVGAADSGAIPGRGEGRWTSKRRPCITGTKFRVWHDPGAARRGGWLLSLARGWWGRPGAPRCVTNFQSSGKAIMSDRCMPTRISRQKLGHQLDEEQSLQGAAK